MAVVEQDERAPSPSGLIAPARAPALPAKRSPLLLELSIVAFLGWIYNWLQDLAPLRKSAALHHGADILSLEQRLGIAPERAMDHWLAGQHMLAYISSDFYDNAIFGITFCFAAWTWWRRPDIYRSLRNTLVLANLAGFAVFWAYPVAPPRMLRGFIDVVERVGGLGSWHNTLVHHADQLAAMPSMHLAWAVWCSIVAWRLATTSRGRVIAGTFAVIYPVSTSLVVLSTGNHYTLDVVAGTACTALAALICKVVPLVRGRAKRGHGFSRRQTLRHSPRPATRVTRTLPSSR
jgi:PAP2 superfamily